MMAMQKRTLLLIALMSLILMQAFVMSVALGSSASVGSSSDGWPMFRQDPNHSGYTADGLSANSAQLLWNYSTGRMVQSSPAFVYGCVFVGSRDSQVYCFNASNGEVIWKYPIRYEVWSSPAIYNHSVYIGADDGYLYCLNINSGRPLWRTLVGIEVRSSPAVVDGVVYVGSQNNLCALNSTNGNIIWSVQDLNPIDSSPAFSNGAVYIGSGDDCVYSFNASTGLQIWVHPLRASDSSSPAVNNGFVYIGSYDGYMYALNASTGAQIWKYQTADEVESSPSVAYGCVYFGSDDSNVYCLNASTGFKIWQSPTGYWVTSSPAVAGGNVYVGSQDDNIYCLNAKTGAKEWLYPTGNIIESSPAITNNTLWIGSDDSKVYALALTNTAGQPKYSQPTNPMLLTTVVFDAIACAIIAFAIFAVTQHVYSSQRQNRKNKPSDILGQNQSWLQAHPDTVFILGILVFSAVFFINLGSGVLQTADEQTYSQWAYHMVKTGDYLTPWAYGAISFMIGKPPMLMWMMSLSYQVFGITNFASRIWTAGFGALSLVIIYYLGKKLYNRPVGFTSAIVLGTFLTYFVFARYAMTDVPLTCFALASVYFFVLSEEKENAIRNAVLSGLFFGLALMTKQIAALLIPLILVAYLIATKKSLRFLFTKTFNLFWSVGLLLFSPWLTYMAVRFGNQFWRWYFIYADVTRSAGTLEGHLAGYLFYFNFLAHNENWLWLALLPIATGLCAYNTFFRRSKHDALIFLWMTIVLLVFSFAQTKIYWYIMPVFPAFAIAISSLLYQLASKIRPLLSRK
ncbi:MAG: PQQ-binding-like beta-propeller repeat protein [Candidatus Bathyarchaeia archaeon]